MTTQGEIIIQSDSITNSLNDGILASASGREGLQGQGNSSLPHPGAVRNLSSESPSPQLVPGLVIANNIISQFGAASTPPTSNTAGLSPPATVQVTVPQTGTGILSPNTQYFYEVTAVGAAGETLPSTEASATTSATRTLQVTWGPVAGASGYKIYRGTASGAETLVATITGGAVAQFADTGVVTLGNAGIEFDGDTSGPPNAPVPFGRILNNTIYGGATVNGTGILVQHNASPTIANNIVANTNLGISVDTGSLAANAIYAYEVTAVGGNGGETLPSAPLVATTTTAMNALTLTFSAVSGATGYKIYRGTPVYNNSGQLVGITNDVLVGTTLNKQSSGTITFQDDGQAGVADSPPAANTAGLAPPTLQSVAPIAGGSQALGTVINENLYQGNSVNTNDAAGAVGTNGNLSANGQLFVNAPAGNFYLQAFSPAIDSSVASIADRSAMLSVTQPLGIAPQGAAGSPIQAPTSDINGELRAFEPNQQSQGGGLSPIDRGAIDRVDFTGPSASLLSPADNNLADQDPRVNFVHTVGDLFSEFDILISDGIGSGVNNSSVTTASVHVRRNGVLLTDGVDYQFVYDTNNHIVRLIAASGVWQNGSVYDIYLDNGVKFDPLINNGVPTSNQPGISDEAGNLLQANASNGYTSYELTLANVGNNPPAIVTPSEAQTMYEHTMLAFSPLTPSTTNPTVLHKLPNPITIFDVDANGGVEQVTLTASVGTLALVDPNTGLPLAPNAIPGVNFSGLGTPASPLVITGPLGSATDPTNPGINTALADLVYQLNDPSNSAAYYFNGTATITVVANDEGNTPPPAQITTVTVPVTVIAVNNPPFDNVPGGVPSATNPGGLLPTMDFPAASAAAAGLTFQ
ncbi:MAG: hypothetical protein ACREHD_32550, partial [Pirellulales bacterium]